MLREGFGGGSASCRLHICLFADTSASLAALATLALLAVAHISSHRGRYPTTFKEHLGKQTSFYSWDTFPNSTPLSLPV